MWKMICLNTQNILQIKYLTMLVLPDNLAYMQMTRKSQPLRENMHTFIK